MTPRKIYVSTLISVSTLILCIDTYARAIDITITGQELDVYLRAEYNRSFGDCGGLSVIGAMKPHDIFTLSGGLFVGSLSEAGDVAVADVKAFASVRAAPFSGVPLRFSVRYVYNGLFYYDVHANSILPVVSYGIARDRAGASYGPCFRFTSFFGESAQYELINSFSAYISIISNEKRRLDAIVGNYCDFYAKNMGAYSFKLNYAAFITGNWTAVNEIELLQSGSDALVANFYGVAWRGGAKYSW